MNLWLQLHKAFFHWRRSSIVLGTFPSYLNWEANTYSLCKCGLLIWSWRKNMQAFSFLPSVSSLLTFLFPLYLGKKKCVCASQILFQQNFQTWDTVPFAAARVPLNGGKGDLKTSPCFHVWFVCHQVQIATVFRSHRSPGPALHLLLAPAKAGMCQPRGKDTRLDKVCADEDLWCFFTPLSS